MNALVRLIRNWTTYIGDLASSLPSGKTLAQAIDDGDLGGSSGSDIAITQLVLNNITGSAETPYVHNITMTESLNFKKIPIEILQFVAQAQDVVTTLCSFLLTDTGDFTADEYLVFDGMVKLKTDYVFTPSETVEGDGYKYSITLQKSVFKEFSSFSVT